MNWIDLTSETQFTDLISVSETKPVIIFKHSTRCSISVAAKSRLERKWDFTDEQIAPYYLDLLQYREVSNAVAQVFEVHHESPQLILIKNGECTYVESHSGITVEDLHEQV